MAVCSIFPLKSSGDNGEISRWCDVCPLNHEPDYSGGSCWPCRVNYFKSQNKEGFCEEWNGSLIKLRDSSFSFTKARWRRLGKAGGSFSYTELVNPFNVLLTLLELLMTQGHSDLEL